MAEILELLNLVYEVEDGSPEDSKTGSQSETSSSSSVTSSGLSSLADGWGAPPSGIAHLKGIWRNIVCFIVFFGFWLFW